MDNIAALMESFYTKFVLRDLFGKIVPGLIFLSSIVISLTSWHKLLSTAVTLSFWNWAIALGLAWVAGLAIQGAGERRGLMITTLGQTENENYDKELEFYYIATDEQKIRRERLVVILEACGNTYVSLIVSMILLSVSVIQISIDSFLHGVLWIQFDYLRELVRVIPAFVGVVFAIRALRWMHFEHVRRQILWRDRVIKSHLR